MLKPPTPRDEGFLRPPAGARARLLPGHRVRGADPAGRAGDSPARVGEPAFLAAARLARGGAGAHAIAHGDDITGATTFRLVAELDAYPVYGVVTEPIGEQDTAGDLLARLAESGASLLVATLDGIEAGQSGAPAAAQPRGSAMRPS